MSDYQGDEPQGLTPGDDETDQNSASAKTHGQIPGENPMDKSHGEIPGVEKVAEAMEKLGSTCLAIAASIMSGISGIIEAAREEEQKRIIECASREVGEEDAEE